MLRQYIPARLADNPSLDAEEYSARLLGLRSPYLVKAMLEGSWDIVAGGMFDDLWNPGVHVIAPFEIPSSWRIDRSFDWALRGLTASVSGRSRTVRMRRWTTVPRFIPCGAISSALRRFTAGAALRTRGADTPPPKLRV